MKKLLTTFLVYALMSASVSFAGPPSTPPQEVSGTPEGTAIKSTGINVGWVIQADGDDTCSWVQLAGGGDALVANPLSQFAATTSAQLAGVISNETGSGLSVFGTAPNITAPTGIVTDDITESTDKKYVTDAEKVLIGQPADTTNSGYLLTNDWDTFNDKVDNATHTGEVTGSGALVVDKTAITGQGAVTAVGADYVIISDTGDSGNLKKALVSDFASAGGDLKADGTVPLTANWDVGAFTLTGTRFISDIAIGTAPFGVTSTTVVPNLNVSQLLGQTWADPGAIGGTTPAAITGTTITATTGVNTGNGTSSGGAYFSMLEDTDNGTNFSGWGVYGNLATDTIYMFPLAAPTANQILQFAVPGNQTMSDGTTKSVSVGTWTSPGAETNSLETTITGIADTEFPVGDGADSAVYVSMSGDATMANTGAVTISAGAVEKSMLSADAKFYSIAVASLSDATTPSVLTTAETTNVCLSNYKASGADHVFTMPAAHAAGNIIFQIGDEFQVDIEPNTSDLFYLNGTAMAADEHIQNTSDTLLTRIVGYCVNVNGTLRWAFYSGDTEWVEATP